MKITHIMRDGSVRESMEGVIIPPDQCPTFYKILADHIRKQENREPDPEDLDLLGDLGERDQCPE